MPCLDRAQCLGPIMAEATHKFSSCFFFLAVTDVTCHQGISHTTLTVAKYNNLNSQTDGKLLGWSHFLLSCWTHYFGFEK